MMHSWKGRVSVLTATLLAMMLVALGLTGLLSQAKAGPVTLTFDQGQFTLGAVLKERKILPADSAFPSPDLPLPQRTDIQLNGTETDGALSFPATLNTGTQFPYMNFDNPGNPGQKVPFTFRLKGDGLTGTFDAATGQANLAGTMDLIIVLGTGATFPLPDSLTDVAVPPLGLFARCAIRDIPVDFSTETKAPFTAERFTGGLAGNGSLTTAWDDVPHAVLENGVAQNAADCSTLDTIIHNKGGIWLSHGIVAPQPQPPIPPTCATDRKLCPPPQFSEISDLTLSPRNKKVKLGKKARKVKFTAMVTNSGNIAAEGVVVKIKSSNRKVKVPASKTVTVPANTTLPVKFNATVTKKAKGGSTIRAASNGWSAESTIRIKKAKKPKRVKK